MTMSDPIGDMLTRVRNAINARQNEVDIPASNVKRAIARVLVDEGYVLSVEDLAEGPQGLLRLKLKYKGGKSVIENLQRVSKPSRRVYVGHDQIPKALSGLGVNILSTPQGVMSDRAARQARVGGEILCAVW
jgi:small subunit ribosomal protein S8